MSATLLFFLLGTGVVITEPLGTSHEAPVTISLTPSGWSIVWHANLSPENMTAFKVLQSPEFDACLRRIIESDPEAHRLLSALRPDSEPQDIALALSRVHKSWRAFGVEEALKEAIETRSEGPKAAEVLNRCRKLSSTLDGAKHEEAE